MSEVERFYGWKKDRPDPRDFLFAVAPTAVVLQDVDLRPKMPRIFDQGQLGSCTANACGAVLQYAERKQGDSNIRLSRLEIYYHSRELIGTVNEDSGAEIRDSFKVVAKNGAANENFWPYDISKFTVKPPTSLAASDRYHRSLEYRSVPSSTSSMMSCLAQGFPFAFGFDVYDSFEYLDLANALYNPGPSEQYLGGHAVVCVGYSLLKQAWIVRNSWGTAWGDKGHFYVPTNWMSRNASDAWTITKAT